MNLTASMLTQSDGAFNPYLCTSYLITSGANKLKSYARAKLYGITVIKLNAHMYSAKTQTYLGIIFVPFAITDRILQRTEQSHCLQWVLRVLSTSQEELSALQDLTLN